jgi:hypothetical protein
MSFDRILAIGGVLVGIGGLYAAFLFSPYGTKNDQFCYFLDQNLGYSCFYTRSDCLNSQEKETLAIKTECIRQNK